MKTACEVRGRPGTFAFYRREMARKNFPPYDCYCLAVAAALLTALLSALLAALATGALLSALAPLLAALSTLLSSFIALLIRQIVFISVC
ncbi:MAG TPA: hypothetical protein VF762_02945 [Blastocatellia bacterium]